jgi:peptidoglycan-associated lipoprotein
MKKICLLLLPGLLAVGCAKRQMVKPVENTTAAPVVQSEVKAVEEQSSRFSDWQKVPQLTTIYFNYDQSELLPQTRETLKKNAEYLKTNSDVSVLVEGNCDERGTTEYNLALGERRAAAVRDYYALLGVSKDRVAVISYGNERPANPGHDESAWQQNRRAETEIRSAKIAHGTTNDDTLKDQQQRHTHGG